MDKKRPLTYQEQIVRLQSLGLFFTNAEYVRRQLATIGYYRISSYIQPFGYANNVTWNMVYRLYIFDKKLRILMFDAIECLEIAFRTQIAYQLGQKYGAYWQDNKDLFKTVIKAHNKKKMEIDTFIEIQTYLKKIFASKPPSWECMEKLFFSHLSKICSSLKNRADINGISSFFDMPPGVFCSWLHVLSFTRNLCAHHARLRNRNFCIIPELLYFSKHLKWIGNPDEVKRNKLYYICCMLNYLLQTVNPTSDFKQSLASLVDDYKDVVSLSDMGFPQDWRKENFWTL